MEAINIVIIILDLLLSYTYFIFNITLHLV